MLDDGYLLQLLYKDDKKFDKQRFFRDLKKEVKKSVEYFEEFDEDFDFDNVDPKRETEFITAMQNFGDVYETAKTIEFLGYCFPDNTDIGSYRERCNVYLERFCEQSCRDAKEEARYERRQRRQEKRYNIRKKVVDVVLKIVLALITGICIGLLVYSFYTEIVG